MNIQNNIIKHYLRNVLFVTGTAYAGKSTMCKLLAQTYDLCHCEENYNSEVIFRVIDQEHQPNLNYFNTKKDWQEYLNRTPDEYEAWINGNSRELSGFEVCELIRLSQDRKVIVDTNIPLELLMEIADYNQIAVLLTEEVISSERFFDRDDPEKVFLKEQILSGPTPEKTMKNFKACIARTNNNQIIQEFMTSGCYVISRENTYTDERDVLLKKLSKHFGLGGNDES